MSDNPTISHATWELFDHIGFKGLQAGSILGLFARTPVSAFLHKRRGGKLDASFLLIAATRLNRTTGITTLATLLAGVGLIGFKEGWDQERIEDRVYRLQHNAGQKRTDNFAVGGLLGGSILTFLLGSRNMPILLSGGLAGMAAGILVHVATSQEATGSKVEAAKQSVENVAKEF